MMDCRVKLCRRQFPSKEALIRQLSELYKVLNYNAKRLHTNNDHIQTVAILPSESDYSLYGQHTL